MALCISWYRFLLIFFLPLLYLHNVYASEKSEVLKKVIPSVVTVYTSNSYNAPELFSQVSASKNLNRNISLGSGVIVNKEGFIVTSYHVVYNKKTVIVITNNGNFYEVEVVKQDKEIDLALLKIKDNIVNSLQPITIAASTKDSQIGDDVFTIGNPFGIGISVSSGIISALPASINNIASMGSLIQTDAAMNPGSSGGGLINTKGELIGINTALYSSTGSFSGISFAIPAETVLLFVNRALSGKQIRNYWLGFVGLDIVNTPEGEEKLGTTKGVVVNKIYKDSPAIKAGLKENDIIIMFNNHPVNNISDISFLMASLENNNPVPIGVIRKKEKITLQITPESILNDEKDKLVIDKGILKGITLINGDSPAALAMGVDSIASNVIVGEIKDYNMLYKLGIREGDIFVSLNDQKVKNISSIISLLETKSQYNMVFDRNGNSITINISDKSL